ncbi:MAG: carbohydrate binding family 9 domain-containing protein [Candidatus Aminicenantes bacterium]|nr:carbohydrate binding family 9 domain-containing protein [Candidatus Aminicenantes bacterium]
MLKRLVYILFLIGTTLLFAENSVPAPSPVRAVRAKSPVRIDGVLNEEVWKSEGVTGFRQSDPDDGAPATEKTVVWVAFDKGSLYVAARLYDNQPEGIISLLGRRDADVESDWFVLAVDPYHDRRSGFQFAVNPAGTIQDGTLFNDEGIDKTWDGIWEVAVRIDDQGWTAEIRIPFHQLHFQKKESTIWGVNFFRTIKRKNEKAVYSWIPKEESGYVSRFADLTGLSGLQPRRLVEVLPYTAGRAEFSPAVPGDPFRTGSDFAGNFGFDVKSALQSHLTLNLSVNPDFGQVEVDPAVINISDQETYYEEKRPFFVEGADIFRFGNGGANVQRNLGWSDPSFFYSRRIGRSPQGSVPFPGFTASPDWATILGAAKITSKMGDGWNLGVMTALTQREYALIDNGEDRFSHEVEPFSSYGVVRALKEMGGGFRGLGFIATSTWRDLRVDSLQGLIPKSAFCFGLDGWTFLDRGRTWVLTGWFGGTTVSGSQEAISHLQLSSLHYYQRPDVDYVDYDPNATTLNGWAGRFFVNKQKGPFVFNAALGAMSPGFHAVDLGYHTRGDVINGHVELGYQSFHPGRFFRNWKVTFAALRSYDFGGIRTDENYILNATAQLLNYWTGNLYLSYDPNRTSHYLTRGGPLAAYPWGASIQPSITSDNRRRLVFGLFGHYRDHPYGSYNYSFGASIRWKPSTNFNISIVPEYSWRHSVGQYIRQVSDPLKIETYGVRYVLSDVIQETASMEIRLNWIFTPRLSLQAYLQPFLGTGDFFNYKELRAALTFDFDSYGQGTSTINRDAGIYTVDPDGAGPSPAFSFSDPDFNLKSLRGTVILRWEYRPGSTIYAVWTQDRADHSHPGSFDFDRDLSLMLRAPGDNIFLIKINYRFTL